MTVDVTPVHTLGDFLAQLERMPAKRPDEHYGMSTDWVRRVLRLWPEGDFHCGLRIAADGDVGVVVLSRGWRSSPLSRRHRSLGFNEPSGPGFGGVSIEANGLIGAPARGVDGWVPAVLRQLVGMAGWDELRIGALSEDDARQFAQGAAALGLIEHVVSEKQTYSVDLDRVRDRHGSDYLATRSANLRQQLRRALRRVEAERGPFSLSAADSPAQGHAWLDALAALHRRRWNAQGQPGGFTDPAFGRYHHTLVEQMQACGEIEILQARAGHATLGYLYNFVVDGRVYFDMSGIDHDGNAAYRPGLLMHWQAIERHLRRGLHVYDFQAGTNRYKQSLCTDSATRIDLVLRRPLAKFRLEHALRRLKRRWRSGGAASRR